MFSIDLNIVNGATYEIQNQIRTISSIQEETTDIMNSLNTSEAYEEIKHKLKDIIDNENDEMNIYLKLLNCLKTAEDVYRNTEKRICEYADMGLNNPINSLDFNNKWVPIDKEEILGNYNIKFII